jgi:glycosyltransferase involved in cell wall biosynthesis
LVLVGEGQRQAELQQLVGELGMTGQVTFLGYVAFPALAAIYRAAEVVVVPSLYEPFGLVALEAMAAGRPVVAAEAGGLTEIVTEGATGLCVPPGDAGALAAALERVLSDGALAGRLARQGREHAVSGYSWSRVAELTRDCYRRALAKRQETAEG